MYYLLDKNLFSGERYLPFEQLRHEGYIVFRRAGLKGAKR